MRLLSSRDAGEGVEGEIDFPPKCSGGFTAYLLIKARAIYSRQEERRLLCQKQNKGHSGWCRLLFLPSGRHVVSLNYAVTQTNRDQLDSTGASCLSVLLDSLLSKMLLRLLDDGRVEGDPSIALTPVMDPDSDTIFARTVPKAVD